MEMEIGFLCHTYLEIAPGMANHTKRRVKYDICLLVKREADPLRLSSSSANQCLFYFPFFPSNYYYYYIPSSHRLPLPLPLHSCLSLLLLPL